ncbi:MAG: DNA alkylation repair protein [archaeon]
MLNKLKKEIEFLTDPNRGTSESKYSKTGPGDYAEGQIFLGIKTSVKRDIAKKYSCISLDEIDKLIEENIHANRFIALVILTNKYKKDKQSVVDFYLKNSKKWNNWGLVDVSADKILGDYLLDKERDILYGLARSDNLWEKRIAIVSTYAFIRQNKFEDTLAISEILLGDSHDLIHKAVGWMLREVGKKDEKVLEEFLKKNYADIPRTTLRYAIERFEEGKRKRFLKGEI